MPTAIALPVMFRVLAGAIFVAAALIAGAANRSILVVPLLAAAAIGSQFIVRQVAPSPIDGLRAAFSPDAPPPDPVRTMPRTFGIAVLGYGAAFGLSALIAALFQTTDFERQVGPFDFWLIGAASVIAIICSVISAKMGAAQVVGVMGQFQQAFADMKANQASQSMAAEDEFIIDGEADVVEDDDPR